MGHQMACHVFDAVTATEVYAHQRACYFAVLVAESGTTKPQLAVNNRTDITVKFLHHVKNSTERRDFLRFNAIFVMPLMILLVLNCSTKISEKSDMAKS